MRGFLVMGMVGLMGDGLSRREPPDDQNADHQKHRECPSCENMVHRLLVPIRSGDATWGPSDESRRAGAEAPAFLIGFKKSLLYTPSMLSTPAGAGSSNWIQAWSRNYSI